MQENREEQLFNCLCILRHKVNKYIKRNKWFLKIFEKTIVASWRHLNGAISWWFMIASIYDVFQKCFPRSIYQIIHSHLLFHRLKHWKKTNFVKTLHFFSSNSSFFFQECDYIKSFLNSFTAILKMFLALFLNKTTFWKIL